MYTRQSLQNKRLAIMLFELGATLRTRWLSPLILLGAIALVGCDAHPPINAPIASQDLAKGYRLQRVKADPDNPEMIAAQTGLAEAKRRLGSRSQ